MCVAENKNTKFENVLAKTQLKNYSVRVKNKFLSVSRNCFLGCTSGSMFPDSVFLFVAKHVNIVQCNSLTIHQMQIDSN